MVRAYTMADTHGADSSETPISAEALSRIEKLLMPGYLLALMMLKDKGIEQDQVESKLTELTGPQEDRSEPAQNPLDFASDARAVHDEDYRRQHLAAALNPTQAPIRAIAGTQNAGIGLTNPATKQEGDVEQEIRTPIPAQPVSITERTQPQVTEDMLAEANGDRPDPWGDYSDEGEKDSDEEKSKDDSSVKF